MLLAWRTRSEAEPIEIFATSPKSASNAFMGCSAFESAAGYRPITGSPNASAERAAHEVSHAVRSRSNGKVGVHIVQLNWLAITFSHGQHWASEANKLKLAIR
jgi:hypothetical protein